MSIKVAVFFGGKSAEHEVSLASAKCIRDRLDRRLFSPLWIGVDKGGDWHLCDETLSLENSGVSTFEGCFRYLSDVDVVFPIFHGPFGEDGSFQGFLQFCDLPYVGASCLGSSINMDKDVMKRLLREAGFLTPKFLVFQKKPGFAEVAKVLGLPLFVKPVNMGSSIGISKVSSEEEFEKAIELAFSYDTKIIIEEAMIEARELECSVLGLDTPIASLPGEVVPKEEFYSYEAKYNSTMGTEFYLPVTTLPEEKVEEIRELSLKIFSTLCCEGMARIDFFMDKKGALYVNELNTIPGFTEMSVYPKLWQVSGIEIKDLITHLIEIAFARHAKKKRLSTDKAPSLCESVVKS